MNKTTIAPGQNQRKGISLLELAEMFPDEDTAGQWLETQRWGGRRRYPYCDTTKTIRASHKTMPYWCTPCRKYFSVKTNTVLQSSKIPLRKWVWAFYLSATGIKGVSSMKLHRDLGIPYKTAWFMSHRIREAWSTFAAGDAFGGPVEVDEAYFGGLERNKHADKRNNTGRGPSGKQAVVGVKDRDTNKVSAEVIEATDSTTLNAFVDAHTQPATMVYTDGATVYKSRTNHEAVQHSVGEYVRGRAHTNGVEGFWALLKRGYYGTYHRLSVKRLQRYVDEFAGRHNLRGCDTIDQMAALFTGSVGERLKYVELVG